MCVLPARSWLWLSRLAAAKEFAFMEALGAAGFPVPRAIEHNRHAVLMSLVDAVPLVQVRAYATHAAPTCLHISGTGSLWYMLAWGASLDIAALAQMGLPGTHDDCTCSHMPLVISKGFVSVV